jgi:hypothetical protein
MNDRIAQLLAQITALEDDLRTALREQEDKVIFTIRGKRVEFESSVREAHLKLKTHFLRWLVINRPWYLLTGPIIYSMVLPLMVLDLCVSFYQYTCFPVYGVPRVRRADYIVFDRQHLAYLNFIEKFHCSYCAYGSGLMGYMGEIVARTEQYFCPIKHAHKVVGTHERYHRFLEYGDARDYQVRLEKFRVELEAEQNREGDH